MGPGDRRKHSLNRGGGQTLPHRRTARSIRRPSPLRKKKRRLSAKPKPARSFGRTAERLSSDVPPNASAGAAVSDPDTGRVYSLGVNGYFSCIDGQTGKTVCRVRWVKVGTISPLRRRTHPPAFSKTCHYNAVMVGWGRLFQPCVFGLDKNTGDVRGLRTERPEDTVSAHPVNGKNGQLSR